MFEGSMFDGSMFDMLRRQRKTSESLSTRYTTRVFGRDAEEATAAASAIYNVIPPSTPITWPLM
jgi:hypothetical protein